MLSVVLALDVALALEADSPATAAVGTLSVFSTFSTVSSATLARVEVVVAEDDDVDAAADEDTAAVEGAWEASVGCDAG
jgi:hypothetical protein